MDTDRNLLFGVLALQTDLIDRSQFIEACTAWAARKDVPVAELLIERGWITSADRADVERLLERKLKKNSNDVRASLVSTITADWRDSLAALNDPEIAETVTNRPQDGTHEVPFIPPVPLTRERYTLIRVHDRGGMGRVWLARDDHLGREVALKELRGEWAGDPGAWARFVREARVTGQLEHPAIVPVYELARRPENQQPFYTMRFVEGRTLTGAATDYHQRRSLGQAKSLELRALLNAFVTVCNAVAYAHARGVVHRDLKGKNVLLGEFGEVIVLDWGLAKVLGQTEQEGRRPPVQDNQDPALQATVHGAVLGTPEYMAPEQAAGQLDRIDRRTDVYGLGGILYELLTGQPPFSGASDEVLLKVRTKEPARPREHWAGVPRALEAVCLRALAKDPGQRYASARQLAQEIQRWLADEPVDAYHEPLPARVARWGRRHRSLMASAAVLLVTAVTALSISTLLIGQARARAETNYRLAREAVDRYHTLVSESKLLDVPGLQPLRRELLQAARDFYERLVAERHQDGTVEEDLGWAYFRLGRIAETMDSKPQAVALLEQALSVFKKLTRAHPNDIDAQSALGRCLSELGNLYDANGERDRAAEVYGEARSCLEKLVSVHPDNPRDHFALAKCLGNLGTLYSLAGDWTRAEDAYTAALRLLDQLVTDHPEEADYQSEQAKTFSNRGVLYNDVSRMPQARQDGDRALAIRQKLVETHPEVLKYREELATSFLNRGVLFSQNKQEEPALHDHETAVSIFQKLAGENPTVKPYRHKWARSCNILGVLYRRARKAAQATQTHETARRASQQLVEEDPNVSDYQYELALSHVNLGHVYTVSEELDQAVRSYRDGIAVFERLVAGPSPLLAYVTGLGGAYGSLADLLAHQGDLQGALEWYDKAINRLENVPAKPRPALTEYFLREGHIKRAKVLARLGDSVRAIAEMDALISQTADEETLYQSACVYSLLLGKLADADKQRADDYASRAVALLKRAQTAGYFNDPGAAAELDKDEELAALRDRQEYRQWRTSVKQNTEKSGKPK